MNLNPRHLFYQVYFSLFEQNDCIPTQCGEVSEYSDSAHAEVVELFLTCINESNVPIMIKEEECINVDVVNNNDVIRTHI